MTNRNNIERAEIVIITCGGILCLLSMIAYCVTRIPELFYVTLIGLILIISGCDSPPSTVIGHLSYTIDYRTNMCFATYHLAFNNAVMSNVPCTPEVLRQIQ